ncbi:hypothetical protein CDAR_480351 [Caerostris darwini]|uniref:Transmembrane protein n=1 Tax=Caerostris darwini TaxID=1538125 RepID=A0AAV4V0B4_9ARAC|nr:hypothetical protein CDAR_480351 [Caerostris darwini]
MFLFALSFRSVLEHNEKVNAIFFAPPPLPFHPVFEANGASKRRFSTVPHLSQEIRTHNTHTHTHTHTVKSIDQAPAQCAPAQVLRELHPPEKIVSLVFLADPLACPSAFLPDKGEKKSSAKSFFCLISLPDRLIVKRFFFSFIYAKRFFFLFSISVWVLVERLEESTQRSCALLRT